MSIAKRLTKLEVILSVLLVFIPLILILFTNEVRSSISNYAYSSAEHLFAMLLSIASAMFIVNGTAYNKKWYNIVLGCSLIGVIMTPHLDHPLLHYSFAGLFFVGSVFVMIYFSSAQQRAIKITAGTIIILAMLGHFITNFYSLLVAEWIGLLPISIHFIGESLNKLD